MELQFGRLTKREREKKIAGIGIKMEGEEREGWHGLVWKISTSYKSAVARTENGG